MSEGDPLQNQTQEATGNPREPGIEPTVVANEAGSDNGGPPKSHVTTRPMPLTDAVGGRPVERDRSVHPKWTLGSLGQRSHDLQQQPEHPDVRVERRTQCPNRMEKRASVDAKPRNEIHMIQIMGTNPKRTRVSLLIITFSEDDPILEHCTGDDPLIITADIGTTQIYSVYVDGENSMEIMYEHYFEQLPTEEKETMRPPTTLLVGFTRQVS
nr:hypothetical protein [Tanacetum cinerariifolium]